MVVFHSLTVIESTLQIREYHLLTINIFNIYIVHYVASKKINIWERLRLIGVTLIEGGLYVGNCFHKPPSCFPQLVNFIQCTEYVL